MQQPSAATPASGKRSKIISAAEAARLIRDGDTVATGGFVGIGFAENIAVAIEKRFLGEDPESPAGNPRNLTLAYAAGQAASAVTALVTGFSYDRVGARVLFVLPVMVTAVPVLAFSQSAWVAVVGVACWGAANGLQDSTVKALVADLVPSARRATAYGVFAAIQGVAAVSGGALAGWLYQTSLPALVGVVAATQLAMALLLIFTLRWQRQHEAPC